MYIFQSLVMQQYYYCFWWNKLYEILFWYVKQTPFFACSIFPLHERYMYLRSIWDQIPKLSQWWPSVNFWKCQPMYLLGLATFRGSLILEREKYYEMLMRVSYSSEKQWKFIICNWGHCKQLKCISFQFLPWRIAQIAWEPLVNTEN